MEKIKVIATPKKKVQVKVFPKKTKNDLLKDTKSYRPGHKRYT